MSESPNTLISVLQNNTPTSASRFDTDSGIHLVYTSTMSMSTPTPTSTSTLAPIPGSRDPATPVPESTSTSTSTFSSPRTALAVTVALNGDSVDVGVGPPPPPIDLSPRGESVQPRSQPLTLTLPPPSINYSRFLNAPEPEGESPVKVFFVYFSLGVIGILTFLFLLRLSGTGSGTRFGPTVNQPATCVTPECRGIVGRIRDSMDESASPCVDFYKYACGSWIKQESLKLREDFKILNSTSVSEMSGMDNDNIQRMRKLIEGLPSGPPSSTKLQLLPKIKRFYDSCIAAKNLLFIYNLLYTSKNSTNSSASASRKGTPAFPGFSQTREISELNRIMAQLHPHPHPHPHPHNLPFHRPSASPRPPKSPENDTATRTTICTQITRDYFPEAIAGLFVTSHHLNDPEVHPSLNRLLSRIRTTFRNMILFSSPWIPDRDYGSNLNISGNIGSMEVISGYLDDVLDSTLLEGHFADVSISGDFVQNLFQLFAATAKREQEFGGSIQYYAAITRANAFYMDLWNSLFIPAGLVQTPMFHPSYPDILQFAKLGTIVAHEFAHSLHPFVQGVSPDAILYWSPNSTTPILRGSVVSPGTRESYRKRCQCVIQQYSGFEVPLPVPGNGSNLDLDPPLPVKVNGTLTLRENLADILGIQIAFQSFQENAGFSFRPISGLSEKFSKEQLFFIASAQDRCHAYLDDQTRVKLLREEVLLDDHSPDEVRVWGMMANFHEFSKAFHCPLGSRYNPVEKCEFLANDFAKCQSP